MVTTEDPRPFLSTQRFLPGAAGGELGMIDWREVCRHLNRSMAERPWPNGPTAGPGTAGTAGTALWTELTDEEGHGGALLGSQSPHIFWIGGDRLLGVAGGYSPDVVGGAALHPLREVYLLDLPSSSGTAGVATRPDLVVKRLDCGTAGGWLPHGHPSMNGAASDFDPIRRCIYFFGGAAPHSDVHNACSALCLEGWEGDDPRATWQVVASPGSVESDQMPSPVQGVKGTVFQDEFVIFGGRRQGGRCTNDVWSLDLAGASFAATPTLPWRRLECDGEAPSPRVWHSACQAVHGQWFIYGGSTWQFEEPAEPHDFRTLFVFHIADRRWSSVAPASPLPRPPWAVAASLVPLGCCQLLLLGGTLPHMLGATGLNAQSLRQWRSWYNRLDEPWVFDLRTQEWSCRRAAVASTAADDFEQEQHIAEVYLRSHFAASFIPQRRSVVVLGGSRYFTGEYFNDLLELQLPSDQQRSSSGTVLGEGRRQESQHRLYGEFQAPNQLPRHLQLEDGRQAQLTRGFLGRLRGMLQEGIIDEEQFNMMRSPN